MPSSPRFHLISGNRLDALAAELGSRLAREADPDSLQPDTILVPQPALRQWLQQTLAERHGVAANLDMPTPSEFVWRLLRAASDTPMPEASPWDRERLRWRLYALLERMSPYEAPAAVRRFLQRSDAHHQDEGARALTRLALADRLAAAFDRYQAYRRDWLDAWQRGEDRDDWQALLWRALCADASTAHRARLIGDWLARYDRGDRDGDRREGSHEGGGYDRHNNTLHCERHAPPGLPSRLAAFGTTHVSPDVLRMLAVAGQWCALDFYLPTPSAEYWGDVESLRERLRRDGPASLPAALAELQRDNPPLSDWGAGGRDILAQIFSYESVRPEAETECFLDPGRGTVLHRLQQDVLHRAAPRADTWSVRDRSLQIHVCHSKLREIEILHDRLRALLDDERFDPPLQPHEIAVMAPDIGQYLPLARAVFGGLDADDPRYIPFTLADRPQVQAHALIAWFLALLDLGDTPLRVGGFRDLIALPPVMQTLGLSQERLARLDDWFAAAGIRWGEDAAARERAGVGRWREYSFDFGFERLLAGYAAGHDAELWRRATRIDVHHRIADGLQGSSHAGPHNDDEAEIEHNPWIAPYAEVEGGDADVLDSVLQVYARLRALAAWMRAPHPASEWRWRLLETVTALIGTHAQDSAEAQARRWLLDALDALAEDAAEADALSLAVVREALRGQLSQASAHQPWLAGGVTFAGMVPLRTVPFRVVCLLGLDADAYPRREPAQDIDRTVDAVQGRALRRLGDRSVREDDRFLFLQLLCAAGEVFYLSYGGRDARDGSVHEPAAPIVELLDTLDRMDGSCAEQTEDNRHRSDGVGTDTGAEQETSLREHVVLEHPLQPFSPRAFGRVDGSEDPRAFSYREEWRLRTSAVDALTPPPPFVREPLPAHGGEGERQKTDATPTRDALQAFFANPAKVWLNMRLGLRWPAPDAAIDDREPLGGDGLQRHAAIDALLHSPLLALGTDEQDHDRGDIDTVIEISAPDDREDTCDRGDRDAMPTAAELAQALRAAGKLAPGRDGDVLLDDALPLARAMRRRAAQEREDAAPTMLVRDSVSAREPVEFAFHDVLRDAAGGALRLVLEAGRLDGKRRLRAGLDHLLLAATYGVSARTVLIGEGEKTRGSSKKTAEEAQPSLAVVVFGDLDTDTARAHLRRLLALLDEGRDAPLPFAPKAAWAYIEALRKTSPASTPTDAAAAAWKKAREMFSAEFGESGDPYLALAFRPEGVFDAVDSPRARRFRALAEAVFDALPMREVVAPTKAKPAAAASEIAIAKTTTTARTRRKPAEPAA
jgi:exodeoxyribonuclease V gamma subunit